MHAALHTLVPCGVEEVVWKGAQRSEERGPGLRAENVYVCETLGYQVLDCGCGCVVFEFSSRFADRSSDEVEHYARESRHAEMVEWVEEHDGGGLAGERNRGGEGGGEDCVRDGEVDEGGFAGAGGVVGWWWRDEFEDWGRGRGWEEGVEGGDGEGW